MVPTYEIFRGRHGENNVRWIEPVEGLGPANERMKELAAKQPGPYFVFSVVSHSVVASLDTTPDMKHAKSDSLTGQL